MLLTNLQLLSDSEAGLGLMHGDGGASNRLGATRIDEDSVCGAETNMLQSACCVPECVCLCVGGGVGGSWVVSLSVLHMHVCSCTSVYMGTMSLSFRYRVGETLLECLNILIVGVF